MKTKIHGFGSKSMIFKKEWWVGDLTHAGSNFDHQGFSSCNLTIMPYNGNIIQPASLKKYLKPLEPSGSQWLTFKGYLNILHFKLQFLSFTCFLFFVVFSFIFQLALSNNHWEYLVWNFEFVHKWKICIKFLRSILHPCQF